MEINDLAAQCHQMSIDKGWYEGRERQPLEFHMLMVTEISEASEEIRNNRGAFYFHGSAGNSLPFEPTSVESIYKNLSEANPSYKDKPFKELVADCKPEGESVELADCIIRLFDYFAKKGWDVEAVVRAKMEYNRHRPHRHGGKAL